MEKACLNHLYVPRAPRVIPTPSPQEKLTNLFLVAQKFWLTQLDPRMYK